MALNPLAVPKALLPFFKGGGIKNLLDAAQQVGTGLPLINALRRMYPNKPGVPNDFYQQLLGWLNNFARDSIGAGRAISNLSPSDNIDPSVMPQNFFLRRPDFQMCNHYFRTEWTTIDRTSGASKTFSAGLWVSDLTTLKGTLDDLQGQIQDIVDAMSADARSGHLYRLDPTTVKIFAAVRLC